MSGHVKVISGLVVPLSQLQCTDCTPDRAPNTQKNKSLSIHFNLPGHKVSDMKVTVIEKVYNKNPLFLREREKIYMINYNTRHQKGLKKNS